MNNTIAVYRCALEIEQYRAKEGRLPSAPQCLDFSNRPVLYREVNGQYVLISYGWDGKANDSARR